MTADEDNARYQAFIKGAQVERAKEWSARANSIKRDSKREHIGEYFLGLSVVSLLGGMISMVYGLAGKDWVQKPYLILGGVLILVGLSIVIGGFGKVKA
jgi:hypothetical protein